MIRKVLILACFLAGTASSQDFYGQDILGLAMQDVGMVAKTLEQGQAIGVLAGTFGPTIKPLRRLLVTGKVPAFRAHLINGTCWRNRVCEAGEPRPNNIKAIRKRAKEYADLQAEFPNVKCFLSPVLEHDEKDKGLVLSWVRAIHDAAPQCEVVISAFSGWVPPGVLVERHGNDAKGDIISNDGESLFDSNSPKYRTGGRIMVLGWINRYNLRVTGEKTFTPPSKRKHKASKTDLIQAMRLLKPEWPKAQPPGTCQNTRDLKDRELLKTNAEDYGNGDARGNKPLFISKSKSQRMKILSPNGKEIGCTSYYGPYEAGYNRHYVGSCSGDSGVSLMDKANHEWVFVKDGNTCVRVNSIRRKGYYR